MDVKKVDGNRGLVQLNGVQTSENQRVHGGRRREVDGVGRETRVELSREARALEALERERVAETVVRPERVAELRAKYVEGGARDLDRLAGAIARALGIEE